MKKFVGDLSLQDAELLERYVARAKAVLEFGVGGSTQIIAQSIPEGAKFASIDTDPSWMRSRGIASASSASRTAATFSRTTGGCGGDERVAPVRYYLDDGVDHLRRQFALDSWVLLEPGGFMLFHDTRRFGDFVNVAWVMQSSSKRSRRCIAISAWTGGAATSPLSRRSRARRISTGNHSENKPLWMYGGFGPVPDDFWKP
jgi:hypothetical protein